MGTLEFTVNLLQELIGFNTENPPGNELPLAEHIVSILRALGAESRVEPVGKGRANVIAHIKGRGDGKSLLLNGHLDVVPADGNWSSEPFQARINDGKVYGRGSSDMKGAIACMIGAVKEYLDQGRTLAGDLYLLFSADEECDNIGTKAFLSNTPHIDYAIIGEPTMLGLCIGHRGVSRHRITVNGKSCHAGNPQEGVNAVEKMAKIVAEITKLNQNLNSTACAGFPAPSIVVSTVRGGNKHNIIPDVCEIVTDRRTIPGETSQSTMEELEDILKTILSTDPSFSYRIEPIIYLASSNIDLGDELVELVRRSHHKAFQKEIKVSHFNACCEQGLFMDKGIKTVICGPGDIKQAHTVDEFIEISQINKAIILYKNILEELFG